MADDLYDDVPVSLQPEEGMFATAHTTRTHDLPAERRYIVFIKS